MSEKACKFCGSKLVAPLLMSNGVPRICSNENCSSHIQGELTLVAGGIEVLGWLKDYIPRKDVEDLIEEYEKEENWGAYYDLMNDLKKLQEVKGD